MFNIYKNDKKIGCIKDPVYVLKTDDDVFILTDAENAQYLSYNGAVYNLLGLAHDEDKETVMLLEVDDGSVAYQSQEEINKLILSNIM